MDPETISELPRFCFPYQGNDAAAVEMQYFAFRWHGAAAMYGFCIQNAPPNPSADVKTVCIVTKLGWHDVFHHLVRQINVIWRSPTAVREKLNVFLDALLVPRAPEVRSYSVPFPDEFGLDPFLVDRPHMEQMPAMSDREGLKLLVKTLGTTNILTLFCSLIFDRRVIVTSASLGRISGVIYAIDSLLFPLRWEQVLIPIMPTHLLDYCMAPMPFMVGLHSSLLETVQREPLEPHVLVDIDANEIACPHSDYDQIPSDLLATLRGAVKKAKHSDTAEVDHLPGAFLRFFIELLGGCKDHFEPHCKCYRNDSVNIKGSPSGCMHACMRCNRVLFVLRDYPDILDLVCSSP
jgi:hypothetical protein